MNRWPRPGDLTVPFSCGSIDCYRDLPVNDVVSGVPRASDISVDDGMLFVLAHVNAWLFVMCSSGRMGWVHEYDVGPGWNAGAVFHIE